MLKILIINHTYMATTKKTSPRSTDEAMDINTVAEQVINRAMQAKKMYNDLDPKTKKKIFQGMAAAAAAIAAIGLVKKITTKKKGR